MMGYYPLKSGGGGGGGYTADVIVSDVASESINGTSGSSSQAGINSENATVINGNVINHGTFARNDKSLKLQLYSRDNTPRVIQTVNDLLFNDATGSNSLTILGTAAAVSNSINIGVGSVVSAEDAIQIGSGTNGTSGMFQVKDYPVMNMSTGTVLYERLGDKFTTMPTPSAEYSDGKVYQYIGETTTTGTVHAHFYECLANTSGSFSWTENILGYTSYNPLSDKPKLNSIELKNNKDSYDTKIVWLGTRAEYNALTTTTGHTMYCIKEDFTVPTNLYYTTGESDTLLNAKQNATDTSLRTTSKTVAGAINELAGIVKALAGVLTVQVVATQPASPTVNTIYFIGTATPYQIKLYTSTGWHSLGTTDIDLTQYQTRSATITGFTATTIEGMLDELLSTKQPKNIAVPGMSSTTVVGSITELFNGKQSKVIISTSTPSGGNDGDVWFQVS